MTHIRDGVEMELPLGRQNYYDWWYQGTSGAPNEMGRKLLPGDRLITHCYYDTENSESWHDRGGTPVSTTDTYFPFGEGTDEEMCFNFIAYVVFEREAREYLFLLHSLRARMSSNVKFKINSHPYHFLISLTRNNTTRMLRKTLTPTLEHRYYPRHPQLTNCFHGFGIGEPSERFSNRRERQLRDSSSIAFTQDQASDIQRVLTSARTFSEIINGMKVATKECNES